MSGPDDVPDVQPVVLRPLAIPHADLLPLQVGQDGRAQVHDLQFDGSGSKKLN